MNTGQQPVATPKRQDASLDPRDMVPAAGKSAARPSEAERLQEVVKDGGTHAEPGKRPEGVVSDPDRRP